MSYVVDAKVVSTPQTVNAMGGTELMRSRFINNVDKELLKNVAVNFSRFEGLYENKLNIVYAHDLYNDPMYYDIFSGKDEIYKKVDMFVFVSHTQREGFMIAHGDKIPYEKTRVIHNAIGDYYFPHYQKSQEGPKRLIYHTTPHRGLELLLPIFNELKKHFDVVLDVYSSFKIYGDEGRDKVYTSIFNEMEKDPRIIIHGTVPNSEIISSLQKSHLFIYPTIWYETSCLALMEAIQNGCICVHPEYGALPETAKNRTFMVPMSGDVNQLANLMYKKTKYILSNYENVILEYNNKISNFTPYSLKEFANSWNTLLWELQNGRNS